MKLLEMHVRSCYIGPDLRIILQQTMAKLALLRGGKALLLLGLCVLWFSVGMLLNRRVAGDAPLSMEDVCNSPRVVKITAGNREVRKTFSAKVYAWRSVHVISEVSGKVEEVLFSSGSEIKEGQVIFRVDDRGKLERAKQAEALFHKRELEYQASESLEKGGYSSHALGYGAAAALSAAEADFKGAKLDLDNTVIKAPFTGVIDEVVPQVGSLVSIGQVVARLSNFDQLKVVAHLSESDVSELKVGDIVDVILGHEEVVLEGRVVSIGRVISPETGLCKVEVIVEGVQHGKVFIADGMPARINLAVKKTLAHEIKSSTLGVDDEGNLGIRVLDIDGKVKIVNVDVVDSDSSGKIWVVGAPYTVDLVVGECG